MNTRQLRYAIELSKSLNFSQSAEKLGISQPALSKQILHLEEELGVKLFDRSTTPLKLTLAGEYFVREAEDMLYREDQLVRSMEEFKSGKRGKLTIGISPFRSTYLIPTMAKKFKEAYPEVQIVLREIGSDLLRQEAAEGLYDFAIVNLPVDESVLDVICLEPDTLVLAVPKMLLHTLPHPDNSPLDIRCCRDLPFVTVKHTQEMRQLLETLCKNAGFYPNIAMEVVGLSTAWAMTCAGVGATLLPRQFVESIGSPDSIALLPLKNTVQSRQPVIVTRRGQYLSEYASHAIRLLTEHTP